MKSGNELLEACREERRKQEVLKAQEPKKWPYRFTEELLAIWHGGENATREHKGKPPMRLSEFRELLLTVPINELWLPCPWTHFYNALRKPASPELQVQELVNGFIEEFRDSKPPLEREDILPLPNDDFWELHRELFGSSF